MSTVEKEKPKMKGLDPDLITSLMSKGRQRNAYGPKLMEWIENSDEAAINPKEVWPLEFGQKNASTLYQGFMTAIKNADLTNLVLVKKVEEDIFLLHKERVELLLNPDEDDTEDE